MIFQELASVLQRKEKVRDVLPVIGLKFTGLATPKMEELSLTQKPKDGAGLRNSQSVHLKFSNAGILLLQNCIKVIKQLLTVLHTMFGVEPTLNLHLEESQFLLMQTLTLTLRFLNVQRFQKLAASKELTTLLILILQLCNQTLASTCTQNSELTKTLIGYSPQESRVESMFLQWNTK